MTIATSSQVNISTAPGKQLGRFFEKSNTFQHQLSTTVSSPKAIQARHMNVHMWLPESDSSASGKSSSSMMSATLQSRKAKPWHSLGTWHVLACWMSANVCRLAWCWHVCHCHAMSISSMQLWLQTENIKQSNSVSLYNVYQDVLRCYYSLYLMIISADRGSSSWNLSEVSRESGESWSCLSLCMLYKKDGMCCEDSL